MHPAAAGARPGSSPWRVACHPRIPAMEFRWIIRERAALRLDPEESAPTELRNPSNSSGAVAMGRLLEPHSPNLEESRSELVNTGFWRENVFQKPTAALARADFGKRESPVSPRVAWPVPSRFLHLLFASPRNFPQGHSGAHSCPRCDVGLNGTTRGSLWSFLPDSVALGCFFCAGLSGRILAAHTWFLLHHAFNPSSTDLGIVHSVFVV